MNHCYIGGVAPHIKSNFRLIRFVHREHLESCKAGNFLVGSIARNKGFDDKRGDEGEATISVTLNSPDGWHFEGARSKKYIGIGPNPGDKITGMKGRGKLTIANKSLLVGNPLSLSFALISSTDDPSQIASEIETVRASLDIKDAACFMVNEVDKLIDDLTLMLRLGGYPSTKRLLPISSPINYATREIETRSQAEFEAKVDELFHSGALQAGYLFTKPDTYKTDREFRVIWIGHSGKTSRNFEAPLITDINQNDYVIIQGINFEKHFTEITLETKAPNEASRLAIEEAEMIIKSRR